MSKYTQFDDIKDGQSKQGKIKEPVIKVTKIKARSKKCCSGRNPQHCSRMIVAMFFTSFIIWGIGITMIMLCFKGKLNPPGWVYSLGGGVLAVGIVQFVGTIVLYVKRKKDRNAFIDF